MRKQKFIPNVNLMELAKIPQNPWGCNSRLCLLTGVLATSAAMFMVLVTSQSPTHNSALKGDVTYTAHWLGGQTGHEQEWGFAANWQENIVPGATDDVELTGAVAPIINQDTWTQVNSINSTGLTGAANVSGVIFTSADGSSNYFYTKTIVGNATFNGTSGIYVGPITGNAIFNDSSANDAATITGFAIFNGGSGNSGNDGDGIVQGDAFFASTATSDGTVIGTRYVSVGSIFQWSGASGTDTSYETGGNWQVAGVAAEYPPTADDIAVVPSGLDASLYPTTGTCNADVVALYGFDNPGTISGDAVFNGGGDNYYGTVSGNAVFNDDGYNYGTVVGNATFNDMSNQSDFNGSIVQGNAVFNGSSYNRGQVLGDYAVFNDTSANSSGDGGQVSGDAFFAPTATNGGTVNGMTYTGRDLFDSNGGTHTGDIYIWTAAADADIGNGANYLVNGSVAGGPPLEGDIVILPLGTSGPNYGTVTADTVVLYGTSSYATINGDAVLNGTSRLYGGTLTGTATFNDTSYHDGSYGSTIVGSAIFNDTSKNSDGNGNKGYVTGDAFFASTATNDGTVSGMRYVATGSPGNVYVWTNATGDENYESIGNWVVNGAVATQLPQSGDIAYLDNQTNNANPSYGTLTVDSAHFFGFIRNWSTVTVSDTAVFHDGTYNGQGYNYGGYNGVINGTANFVGGGMVDGGGADVVNGTAIFHANSLFSGGTVNGDVFLSSTSTNSTGTVNGVAYRARNTNSNGNVYIWTGAAADGNYAEVRNWTVNGAVATQLPQLGDVAVVYNGQNPSGGSVTVDTIVFYNAQNSGEVHGTLVLNGFSYQYGSLPIDGTVIMNDSSFISGFSSISKNLIINSTSEQSNECGGNYQCNVLGDVFTSTEYSLNGFDIDGSTYTPSGDIYIWTDSANSNDYGVLGNWVVNGDVPTELPSAGDIAYIAYNSGDLYPNNGTLTVDTIYVYNGEYNSSIDGTVVGNVIFNDYTRNYADITGNATFNDNSYTNYGVISGFAIFNDSSQASGSNTITNGAFFASTATNDGTLTGNAYVASGSPGYIYVWTGASDTDYETASNWKVAGVTQASAPTSGDIAVIPADAAQYPASGTCAAASIHFFGACVTGEEWDGNFCAAVPCGNGTIDGSEVCDDGNTSVGDGCSADCSAIESGYLCPTPGSACSTSCGDSVVAGNEACDDGDTSSGDGCNATCSAIESGFTCATPGQSCNNICGDSLIVGFEACDDGGTTSGDGCTNVCSLELGFTLVNSVATPICGDGNIVGDEVCDDLNDKENDGCTETCDAIETGYTCPTPGQLCAPICGDGLDLAGEDCDDGDTSSGDGCSATCTVEAGYTCSKASPNVCQKCGNGTKEGTEACDDGNTAAGDGCSAVCGLENGYVLTNGEVQSVCGDSLFAGEETCDDGNATVGDGCNATCLVETGFTCSGVGAGSCTANVTGGVSASSPVIKALRSLWNSVTNAVTPGGGVVAPSAPRPAASDVPATTAPVEVSAPAVPTEAPVSPSAVVPPVVAPVPAAKSTLKPQELLNLVTSGIHSADSIASKITLSPEKPVSRVQAVQVILEQLKIPTDSRTATIKDPVRRALVTAQKLGILRGDANSGGLFPYRAVTKTELNIMLERAKRAARK